jgi:hypothetical protein
MHEAIHVEELQPLLAHTLQEQEFGWVQQLRDSMS